MADILVISSNVHTELSLRQRELCTRMLDGYSYDVIVLDAGTYEIPYVIATHAKKKPYRAYLALGLVVKSSIEHYDYIMCHVKNCFTSFALQGLIVGNGIISADNLDELAAKIDNENPCINGYALACRALRTLLSLDERI